MGTAVAAGGAAVAARELRNGHEPDDKGPSRAYKLRPDKPPAKEIRRVALGRIDDARDQLGGYESDPSTAVHEARKDLKKVRSLLRLVRDDLDADTYRSENDRYRDIGRSLSAARDAKVKLDTLATLRELDPELDVSRYESALESERDAEGVDPGQIEAAIAALESGRDAVAGWELPEDGWDPHDGLRRAYGRGRSDLEDARSSGDDETVHDWRKRAKDLWYHLRLLKDTWPDVLKPPADQAHDLSDLLGDHHDLAVLAEDAEARNECFNDGEKDRLIACIRARQDSLLADAVELGDRLYAEKPKPFAKRLRRYWRAAT